MKTIYFLIVCLVLSARLQAFQEETAESKITSPAAKALYMQAKSERNGPTALQLLRGALAAAQRAGSEDSAGVCLTAIGERHRQANNATDALYAFEQAEGAFRKANDLAWRGVSVLQQASVLRSLTSNNQDPPERRASQALLVASRLLEAESILREADEVAAAGEVATQLLALWEEMSSTGLSETAPLHAEAAAMRAVDYSQQLKDSKGVARNLVAAVQNASEFSGANDADIADWADRLITAGLDGLSSDQEEDLFVSMNMLASYAGKLEIADRYGKRALDVLKTADGPEEQLKQLAVTLMNNHAMALSRVGRNDEALAEANRAYVLKPDSALRSQLLSFEAAQGHFDAATRYSRELFEDAKHEQIPDAALQASHLIDAYIKFQGGDPKGSREEFDQGWAAWKSSLNSKDPFEVKVARTLGEKLLGLTELAERLNTEDVLAMATGGFGSGGEVGDAPYQLLQHLYLLKGDVQQAFFNGQIIRARALIAGTSYNSNFSALAKAGKETARAVSFLTKRIASQSLLLLSQPEGDLAARMQPMMERLTASDMRNSLLAPLRQYHFMRSDLSKVADPVDSKYLAGLTNAFAYFNASIELGNRLDADEAFVQFAVAQCEKGKYMLAYVLQKGKPIVAINLGGPEFSNLDAIQNACASFGDVRSRGRGSVTPKPNVVPHAGPSLYELVVTPLLPALKNCRHVIVAPEGPLSSVPLSAVICPDGTPLGDKLVFSYAFSTSSLLMQLDRAGKLGNAVKTGVAVFNPDYGTRRRLGVADAGGDARFLPQLPGAALEAGSVSAAFPNAAILSGKEAGEDAVINGMKGADFLHFATHGYFDVLNGDMSLLVLADPKGADGFDGMLTAEEIGAMTLKAQFAFLAACSTGKGEHVNAEGIAGVGWAFARAGVPCVIVSQWPVDDAATQLFVKGFYGALAKGSSKLDAMTAGEKSVRADPRFQDPVYWSAFELMGDWH